MSDNTEKTGVTRRDLLTAAAGGAAFAGAAGAARMAMVGGCSRGRNGTVCRKRKSSNPFRSQPRTGPA